MQQSSKTICYQISGLPHTSLVSDSQKIHLAPIEPPPHLRAPSSSFNSQQREFCGLCRCGDDIFSSLRLIYTFFRAAATKMARAPIHWLIMGHYKWDTRGISNHKWMQVVNGTKFLTDIASLKKPLCEWMMNKDHHKKKLIYHNPLGPWPPLDHQQKNISMMFNIGSKSTMTMIIIWDPEKLCAFESLWSSSLSFPVSVTIPLSPSLPLSSSASLSLSS